MELILRFGYYGVTGIGGSLILFFWLGNLLGASSAGDTWRHKAILFGSGALALSLLLWSYRMGPGQGQWLGAALVSAAAPLVFAALVFGGLLLFTNIHWQ